MSDQAGSGADGGARDGAGDGATGSAAEGRGTSLHDAAQEGPVVTEPQGAAAVADADDDATDADVRPGERQDVDGEEHDRAYWADPSDEAPGSPGRPLGTGAGEQGPDPVR